MKRTPSSDFACAVSRFFQEFLPGQRGMSVHTIRSYRDTLLLWFRFLVHDCDARIATLTLADLTPDAVVRFLSHLEKTRGNSIATRNVRLAALHTFARFLIGHHPDRMAALQGILVVPFKRGAQRRPVDYLEPDEVEGLLGTIDRSSPSGQRDYALFALMLNTGARVHEVLNLKAGDVRLESPYQVRLVGKGNKVRLCPIWPRTAKLLATLMANNRRGPDDDPAPARIFQNRRGEPLTRFGVRYLLRKHLPNRLGRGSGAGKRIHPHALRHTTAIYLLKAGVDFATISQWLGHASLNTTMRYARADLDLKRQALSQVFPDALGAPAAGRLRIDGSEFTRWLRRL
jgi:site-specific recombinase XerD